MDQDYQIFTFPEVHRITLEAERSEFPRKNLIKNDGFIKPDKRMAARNHTHEHY
jgi:hypothetical protein